MRGDYNGFTEEDQTRGGRVQSTAFGNGMLQRVWECEACGAKGSEPGEIIAHLEDYTEPIDGAIWLCYRCHTVLHDRFNNPNRWNEYRKQIREGMQYPLTKSRSEALSGHMNPPLFVLATKGESRSRTILDDIHDGLLLPPYTPEEQRSKMDEIHRLGIRYFKDRESKQESLF